MSFNAPFPPPGRERSAPRIRRRGVADLCDPARARRTTTALRPGQYLTLRTTMDGEEVRRSYSICSGPDDGELRIAVKKVDGGAFSSWAADELKAGDELDVMTPTGRFGVAHAPERGAGLCRLCRRLRHHADPFDREGRAGARAEQPVLSVLRQSLDRRHAVSRGAGGTEGPLHAAALGLPRHLGRRAGHPDPARPARRREGEGAAALAGAGGKRRSCLHLRPHRHERGHRGDLPRYRHCRGPHSCRALCLRSSAASRARKPSCRSARRRRRWPR